MKMNPFSEYLEVSHLVQTMARDFGIMGNHNKRVEALNKVLDYRYEHRKSKGLCNEEIEREHILNEIKLVRDTFQDNNNKKEV